MSLDGTGGGAFQEEGRASATSGMLSLCLGGKFAYNPEAIYSCPSFLQRLRNLIPLYHSILIIILACSLGSQIGWNSEQDCQGGMKGRVQSQLKKNMTFTLALKSTLLYLCKHSTKSEFQNKIELIS